MRTEARASHRPQTSRPNQVSFPSTRHRIVLTCNQGRGERPGARDQNVAPLPPRKECGSAQPERCVSRPGQLVIAMEQSGHSSGTNAKTGQLASKISKICWRRQPVVVRRSFVKQGLSDRNGTIAFGRIREPFGNTPLAVSSQTCLSSSGHPLTIWRLTS